MHDTYIHLSPPTNLGYGSGTSDPHLDCIGWTGKIPPPFAIHHNTARRIKEATKHGTSTTLKYTNKLDSGRSRMIGRDVLVPRSFELSVNYHPPVWANPISEQNLHMNAVGTHPRTGDSLLITTTHPGCSESPVRTNPMQFR